jgi:small subunit ribosomal protein S1
MSDEIKNEKNGEKSFADLLKSYEPGESWDIQVGDKIKGEIVSIGQNTVFVDTGTKIDGVVDIEELRDENQDLPFQEGDEVELYVVSIDEGEIKLSKAVSGIGGLNMLKDAYRGKMPVEGKVLEQCKGGFRVEMLKRKAFCPISQMDVTYIEEPEAYVGQTHQFLITRLEEQGRNIVVSRRELLSRELEKAKAAFYSTLSAGEVYEGKVMRIMPFGVFVELFPGVEGMVHISELSWSRLEKPDEVVSVGDAIKVLVLGIEAGEKPSHKKISLSVKQIEGDPWESVEARFKAGDKVKGKVIKCLDFGAFVEIAPGIEGLVHISEMSYTKRVLKPEEIVGIGDEVSVMIKDVLPEKRRISLSLRDAEGDPWLEVADKYSPGQAINGTIEKKEKFGYFIVLEPGITGLLPASKIKKSVNSSGIEKLKEGESIAVIVKEIKIRERRITLGPGDSRDESNWQSFASGDEKTSMGSLGEKLQAALKQKGRKNKD